MRFVLDSDASDQNATKKAEACPSAFRETVYESLRFAATTKLRIGRNSNQVVAVRANNFVL